MDTRDCDLSDAQATRLALNAASDTTHLLYAALPTDPDATRESEINTLMLRNVLDGLKANGAPLVVLLNGTLRFSQLRREIEGVSERMLAQTFYS